MTIEQIIHEPTTEKIEIAIKRLKNDKASEEDNITVCYYEWKHYNEKIRINYHYKNIEGKRNAVSIEFFEYIPYIHKRDIS